MQAGGQQHGAMLHKAVLHKAMLHKAMLHKADRQRHTAAPAHTQPGKLTTTLQQRLQHYNARHVLWQVRHC